MKKVLLFITLFYSISSFAQQSYNMSLLGQLNYDAGANDVWGYVDSQENEYAIVGLVNGTSFVDVTDPTNPIEVAFIPGPSCVWRDIKTWNNYAYIVHDGVGFPDSQGLMIVNLSDISNGVIDFSHFYHNSQFNNAHNIYIDEKGCVYLFGGNYSTGGALMFDVSQDPENPEYLGEFEDYYLHDGMVRGDTLWGAAIWEGVVAAIDVSDKSNPSILGSALTPNTFTHNAWISDDGNTVYTTDEVQSGSIASIDVSDVTNMSVIDNIQSWSLETNVIPHNTHVLGKYLVTSYYCDGVTVVDASDPYNLQEVAYYDTSDSIGGTYSGAWGTYPWLPSGNILVTDRQEGLHILSIDNLDFSVESMDALLGISIYPNPSSHSFEIELEGAYTLEVFAIDGKVIEKINSQHKQTLRIGDSWKEGTYLIKIIDSEGLSIVHKLIKINK
jgi:choice-of-anchor B domain-containing protein